MVIFAILSSIEGYEDRAQVYLKITQNAEFVYLIIQEPFSFYSLPKNFKVIHFNGKKRGARFMYSACKEVYQIIKTLPQDKKIIIHDFFWGKVGPFIKLIFPKRKKHIRTVISFYFPYVKFLFEKGWRKGYRNNNKSFFENMNYAGLYFKNYYIKALKEFLFCIKYDAIVGNSNEVSKGVEKYYWKDPKKIHTMPTAVDTDFFHPVKVMPRQFSDWDNLLKILYVGSIQRRKGLTTLIEALSEYKNALPDFHLFIVGEITPYEKDNFKLKIYFKDKGIEKKVTLIPSQPREKLREYYSVSDIFVCPSFYEGSPRVVKEALACGLPALVSDIPGNRIIDMGKGVLHFFPPGEVKILGENLKSLLTNPNYLSQCGKKSREHMVENFSTETISKKHYDLYLSLFGT